MVADFVLDDDGVTVEDGGLRVDGGTSVGGALNVGGALEVGGAASIGGSVSAAAVTSDELRAPLVVSGSEGTPGKIVVHHPQIVHLGVILDGEAGRAYVSNEVVTDRLAANNIVLTAASPLHPGPSGLEDLDLQSALHRINERLDAIEQALGIA